jgi:hypothetical protein
MPNLSGPVAPGFTTPPASPGIAMGLMGGEYLGQAVARTLLHRSMHGTGIM